MKRWNVLVIGDAMLDIRRFGRCTRPNPENPNCKVLDFQERRAELGGAANVARWLAARPDLNVSLLCHYGDDGPGLEMKLLCRESGISLLRGLCRTADNHFTTVKERICQVIDDRQIEHLVRIDRDTRTELTEAEFRAQSAFLEKQAEKLDAVVVADYRKGVFTGPWGEQIVHMLSLLPHRVIKVVNSKCPQAWADLTADYLICNEKEALQVWPVPTDNHYRKRVGALHFVRTEGARGVTSYDRWSDTPIRHPSLVKQVIDVTGAGDAFLAGLTVAALSGAPLHTQLETGSAWAAHCCGQIGCGIPIGCGGSENVNMRLLGWTMVNGLCYNGYPIFRNMNTGELAYEDLNHQCRLGSLPAATEQIVREQL